ncbi:unnamed protein product, partial [Ascophyllum nodosum]
MNTRTRSSLRLDKRRDLLRHIKFWAWHGEKEDREGHLALAGAPGSACTASKTDDPL